MPFRSSRSSLPAQSAPVGAIAICIIAIFSLSGARAQGAEMAPGDTGAVPIVFEKNVGQSDDAVRFLVRQGDLTAWFVPDEIVFGLGERGTEFNRTRQQEPRGHRGALPDRPSRRAAVRMSLVGANPRPQVEGLDPLPGKSHYLIGSDPTRWRTGVTQYAGVAYREVYPGIDLIFHSRNGLLEYDFEVQPGADEKMIEFAFVGVDDAAVDDEGHLVLSVLGGEFRHRRPSSIEGRETSPRALETRFSTKAGGRFGFEVEGRDRRRPLRIDPEVQWRSLVGSDNDWGYAIAYGDEGEIYATGITWSVDFPANGGMPPIDPERGDAFVTKLDSNLNIVYSTYIGDPTTKDTGLALDVDSQGRVAVVGDGWVAEVNPAHPGMCALGTGSEAFLARLAADGASLEYSTCLPASAARGVTFHPSSYVTVAGESDDDVFLGRYRDTGAVLWGANWGGTKTEEVMDMVLDTDGQIVVVGRTASTDLPDAVEGLQPENTFGGSTGFVVKFHPVGSPKVATYLGGSGQTKVLGVATDSEGDVYVTGTTFSWDFPLENASRETLRESPFPKQGMPWDAISTPFVTKLDAELGGLIYSTYYIQKDLPIDGRSEYVDHEEGRKIAVDDAGNAYVVGMAQTFDQATNSSWAYAWFVGFDASGWPGNSVIFDVTANNDELHGIASSDDGGLSLVGHINYLRTCEWIPGQGQNCYDVSDSDVAIVRITDAAEWLIKADPAERECPDIGEPVNIYTGNTWLDQTDVVIPGPGRGISFVRSYNSLNALEARPGPLGPGWTHTYQRSLEELPSGKLELRTADGVPMYFVDPDLDGVYTAVTPLTETSRIEKLPGGGYSWLFRQGGSEGFDEDGRLISLVDSDGLFTGLGYQDDRLVLVNVGEARKIELAYDEDDRIIELTGPLGQIATYTYGASGHLAGVSYPDGTGFKFAYDGVGQLLTVRDATDTVLESHEYVGEKAVTSEISGGVERYSFSYGPGLTTVTDALGHTTTWEWTEISGMKYPTRRTGPCASCGGAGDSEEWVYFSDGRLQTHRDALGRSTRFTYNAEGDLETVTDPLGRVITYEYTYDEDGAILETRRSAPDAGETILSYDGAKLTQIAQQVTDAPSWRSTSFAYAGGRLTAVMAADGKSTRFSYGADGDLLSATAPDTAPTTFVYDEMGRPIRVTDPARSTTRRQYDERGRVVAVTDPDGSMTRFEYDTAGRLQTTTDPLGRVTRYAYDSANRLSGVIDPSGSTTTTRYDAMSRVSALIDGEGRTTQITHDGVGRVTATTYPDGSVENVTYYATGRVETITDRNGVTSTFEYDDAGRLNTKSYSDGAPDVTYDWDDADRLLSVANGTDTLTWTYNLAGDVLTETSAFSGTTVSYGYEVAGRREWMDLDGVFQLDYGYDAGGRGHTVTSGSGVFTFEYDEASRRQSLIFPNGVAASYEYDALSRLTDLEVMSGPTSLVSLEYDHDAVGYRISKIGLDVAESYGYDETGRLASVQRTLPVVRHERYGYDAVGNRVSEQRDGVTIRGVHDQRNELLERTGGVSLFVRGELDEPGTVTVDGQPAQMTSEIDFQSEIETSEGSNEVVLEGRDEAGNVASQAYQVEVPSQVTTYDYDDNGNLLTKVGAGEAWTYEWTADKQLNRVLNDGAEVATFAYDPLGRRVEKVVGAVTHTYVYDGIDILQETISDGVTTTTYRYVHGPGIDEPLAREEVVSGTTIYYHADGLGSIVKMTEQTGALVHTYQYDAWGNREDGAGQGGYAYTGREWDPETLLYYYRARYYDPEIGRFISEDPLRFDSGMSLYGYVDGDPITLTDPSGAVPQLFIEAAKRGISNTVAGAVTGATTGVSIQVFHNLREGADPLKDIWRAAGHGAASGSIAGLISSLPVVGQPLGGAVGARVGAWLDQCRIPNLFDINDPDLESATIAGGIAGFIGMFVPSSAPFTGVKAGLSAVLGSYGTEFLEFWRESKTQFERGSGRTSQPPN